MIDTRLINLSNDLMHLCIEHKVKIASAESCTGGLLSSSITHISGASNYFDRGFISYSNSSKISILGVSPRSIEKFGAVSVEVAQEMAIGAIKNSKADYSIAITGIAGPGGSEAKPEGLVCFGVAKQSSSSTFVKNFGPIGRDKVRLNSCRKGLNILVQFIKSDLNYTNRHLSV